ncbi:MULTISPECIES: polysaccharide deacetylase family protein [unclassified Beijerinckia]|uniref:polysaccharide deacetylase family protein n=1 Tax=unclassified Beijerinckia TaxID=2638183 RepID=UPI0008979846|nr:MULTISPECIES: polysaccharide deacetylase family protein [unclassified Beijerinckia]MDH7799949.1 allantoinase [Beijerinckia sp. GAS462]SED43637.1 Polysaccharide deacetylase [Beijerinckia sp. 28-YEA-48]
MKDNPFPYFPYRAIVDHPPVKWPNGARVAVWIIPNVEHFHVERPGPMPDVRNHSRRDYGNRVGVWRIIEVMEKYGIKGTVALNGEVGLYYPRIMEELVRLDWEVMGHGLTNSTLLVGLDENGERNTILETQRIIEQHGRKMHGWLGPGLGETWKTLDLLKEAGCTYVADWVNDDLPYRMNNGLYAIPYSLELNDMPLFNAPSISNDEFLRRICDSFDTLYREGESGGRVMAIALHPYLIGTPSRIGVLNRALQHISAHDSVWFARGVEIIDAYKMQDLPEP